tara:strand:- start:86177 stop:87406 length:1230 start_codon:yes stop_codon:yes gene_type:complete
MSEAWIIDACRIPRGIGKAGKGALADIHPHYLGSTVLKALQQRTGIDTGEVNDVIWGTSAQGGQQAGNIGRMAALDAGYDVRSSAVTLDRFCSSGLTAMHFAAATIMAGLENMVISGGSEKMSARDRLTGRLPLLDQNNLHLRELHPQTHQGLCADTIATLENIDRAALDHLAVTSQRRADHAIQSGYFDRSLVPVYREDGILALDRDEYPRPNTTVAGLSELRPSFAEMHSPLDDTGITYHQLMLRKYPDMVIDHVHHAGNSSGVVDGAAVVLLAAPAFAKANGLKPRARIVASTNMGDCPILMLNAPVPAAKKVLKQAGLSIQDIDLFEVNEAFAVVVEKFIRDLSIDRDKINVNGGAIALGHPIGATGAILIGTVLDELERQDKQFGLVTMCAGGGMAPAVIIERL